MISERHKPKSFVTLRHEHLVLAIEQTVPEWRLCQFRRGPSKGQYESYGKQRYRKKDPKPSETPDERFCHTAFFMPNDRDNRVRAKGVAIKMPRIRALRSNALFVD
jgi:hypothetical protein